MPPRNARRAPSRAVRWCLVLSALAGAAASAAAQELPFQREYPGSTTYECRAFALPGLPSAEARGQAAQLASQAAQSTLLGDLERAETMLERAAELDPASADLAYRHARVLEDLGDAEGAREEYCRSLALLDAGATAEDARARLEALIEADATRLPSQAVAAFEMGLEAADSGVFQEALEAFEVAEAEADAWPAASYNRAVALDRLGRLLQAAQAYAYYLELSPGAPDAIAVSRRMGQLQSLAVTGGPSPGTALALGVLVPGLGHFYTGRAAGGLTVLALAGGAVAAGFLIQEVDVQCLTPDAGGGCPEGQVVSRTTNRPYLMASLAAAAAVGIAGAIEAYVEARGRRGATPFGVASADPGLVVLPGVGARGGRVDVGLLGLRFR